MRANIGLEAFCENARARSTVHCGVHYMLHGQKVSGIRCISTIYSLRKEVCYETLTPCSSSSTLLSAPSRASNGALSSLPAPSPLSRSSSTGPYSTKCCVMNTRSKIRLMFARPSLTEFPVRPDQSACRVLSIKSCRRLSRPPLKSRSCWVMDQPAVDFRRWLATTWGLEDEGCERA